MVNLNAPVEILVVNFHQDNMDVVLYQKLFAVQMVYIVVLMDIHVLVEVIYIGVSFLDVIRLDFNTYMTLQFTIMASLKHFHCNYRQSILE